MSGIPDNEWLDCVLREEMKENLEFYFEENHDEMLKKADEFGPDCRDEIEPEDLLAIGYRLSKIDRKEFGNITDTISDEQSEELVQGYLGTIVFQELFDE